MAAVAAVHVSYAALVPAFVVSGIGMSLFFVPVASIVLGSVRSADEGVASGINNAIRELGGVLGIAVLGAVFAGSGGYRSGTDFVAGLVPAVAVGAGVVLVAVVAALAMGSAKRLGADVVAVTLPEGRLGGAAPALASAGASVR
jgi:hypothetical protein